jgi:diphthine synthase
MGKLIFIGLGLDNGKDISIKGLELLKTCDYLFAEFYTSDLAKGSIEYLEKVCNKHIEVLDREQVEDGDLILKKAQMNDSNVAFLVPGDPLTATTHIDLLLRAKEQTISTMVIHAPSVATVVPGLLGLQFYKFGRTTTLAYPEGEYFPESPYDVIAENLSMGLHSLVLLDIHADKKRYMTANEGIQILLEINSRRDDETFTPKTLACVVARAGTSNPIALADYAEKLLEHDFGPPLHSIVVPGKLHFKEYEALITLANAPKNILI